MTTSGLPNISRILEILLSIGDNSEPRKDRARGENVTSIE
jgi:hypothetical protein